MIKGKVVGLDGLRESDSDLLFQWINTPETVRFNADFKPIHESAHRAWMESITRDRSRVIFAIRSLEAGKLVGVVQLIDLHPVHRSAELIIRVGEERDRGRGIGTEALLLVRRFAFQDLNLQRVWLRVFADNLRAVRAYEKAGFVHEGRMTRACFINGRWCDELIMATLAPDPDQAAEADG
jgi:RimJ/RimL family protein N-acetyltransferase